MCCGRNRSMLPSMARVGQPLRTAHHGGPQPTNRPKTVTYFQYKGKTALTVVGPVSRTVYRFDAPGRRVVVDLRDRPSLARMPQLVEVASL